MTFRTNIFLKAVTPPDLSHLSLPLPPHHPKPQLKTPLILPIPIPFSHSLLQFPRHSTYNKLCFLPPLRSILSISSYLQGDTLPHAIPGVCQYSACFYPLCFPKLEESNRKESTCCTNKVPENPDVPLQLGPRTAKDLTGLFTGSLEIAFCIF